VKEKADVRSILNLHHPILCFFPMAVSPTSPCGSDSRSFIFISSLPRIWNVLEWLWWLKWEPPVPEAATAGLQRSLRTWPSTKAVTLEAAGCSLNHRAGPRKRRAASWGWLSSRPFGNRTTARRQPHARGNLAVSPSEGCQAARQKERPLFSAKHEKPLSRWDHWYDTTPRNRIFDPQ